MPALTRSTSVLSLTCEGGTFAIFQATYDDTGEVYKSLGIPIQDWRDFGSPREITVTIDPGDTLNP